MFGFLKNTGKNKQLEEIITRIEMNASNNYKDAAQAAFKEYEELLQSLLAENKLPARQKEYYKARQEGFQQEMKNFTHKDQKPTWV